MRIFLAGTETYRYVFKYGQSLKPFVLESYYVLKERKLDMQQDYGDYLLDSGAFSFVNSHSGSVNFDEYLEEYANYVKEKKIKKFFELDIDSIVGYEKVKEYRYRLERITGQECIPVWHKSRGREEYTRMCQEYSYVGIGGIVIKEIRPAEYKYFPGLIKEAHKYGAKIHGLGFLNIALLSEYHFDSVDGIAWITGNMFGHVYYFDGKRMRQKKKGDCRRVSDTRELAKHNFLEWVKYQKYAEVHL